MSSFFVWNNRLDLQYKTVTTTAAGQKKAIFTTSKTKQKCIYMPRFSTTGKLRLTPTPELQDEVLVTFPSEVTINSDMRFVNLRDRNGRLIDAGPWKVEDIKRQPGFGGKWHHTTVSISRVIET